MPEIIDLVDEQDLVVGETTKKEAHEKNLPHRLGCVYVFTADGKLLVQVRKGGILDHSACGHVRKSEGYYEAAVRELREELSVEDTIEEVGTFFADERFPSHNYQRKHWFGLFELKLPQGAENNLKLQDDEVEAMIPMSLEEIADKMRAEPEKFAMGFIFSLNFYIRQKGLSILPVNA